MLCNIAGFDEDDTFINSVAYIGSWASKVDNKSYTESWIKAFKENPRLIVMASTKAEKAVKYILNKE